MKFTVIVHIMPRTALLDPQGKATEAGLQNMGFSVLSNVRVGKRVQVEIEADSADAAKDIATDAAKKLLANLITEQFQVEISA